MNPHEFIDIYCERLAPGLLAEPLNAASNLAFFAAAALIWRRMGGLRAGPDLAVLVVLMACVGAGSLAFHTFATRWAMWLDVGFIVVFMLVWLHRFLRRVAGSRGLVAALGVLAFMGLDVALQAVLADVPLNGSQSYAAALLVLALLTLWCARHAPAVARWLAVALSLFVLSVTLRSLDLAVCASWPAGTHFAWHLLNAGVLYACVAALLASPGARAAAVPA